MRVGMLLAAVGGAALILLAPWRRVDENAAGRMHIAFGGELTTVVAVTMESDLMEPEVEGRLAQMATEAGALQVRRSWEMTDLSTGGAPGDVREVDGTALLDGRVPASVLRGAVVVLDARDQARPRAEAMARVHLPAPGTFGRNAAMVAAALAAALIAWSAARARLRATLAMLAAAALGATGATAAGASMGITLPAVELALVAPLGALGGYLDATLALRRAVVEIGGPLLRSTARIAAVSFDRAVRGATSLGEPLAEILDARALYLLEARPGAREARPLHGFHLRAADLRPGALDLRRHPFGTARAADGSILLDSGAPARLFPLRFGGVTEGYLLAVGEKVASEARPAVVAALGALARDLRRGRLGARTSHFPEVLVEAAAALEQGTAALHAALAGAGTGLLLAAPDGATLWRNDRFAETLDGASVAGSCDLTRALHVIRHPEESLADAMDRVVASPAPIRAACGGLVATLTPLRPLPDAPPTAILVELGGEAAEAALLPLAAPLASPVLEAVVDPVAAISSAAISSSVVLAEAALSQPLH
jgi:hypothetical protein